MVRFALAVLVLAVAGFLVVSRVAVAPYEVVREGRVVKIRGENLAARFSRVGPLSGSFMVFGANEEASEVESAWFLTVSASDGRYLLDEYPDLRRCGSAGAEHFQRIAEGMYVIGGNGSAHRTLQRAAALQQERERDGGERFCLALRGQQLSLDYVGIPAAGRPRPGLDHDRPGVRLG